MNASTTVMTSSSSHYNAPAFWERLWRMSGISFLVCFIAAYVVYGVQPPIGAPTAVLVAFYDGHRMRILIAAFLSGMAFLNLLWFAAALKSTLSDAGLDGWGAAATASSSALSGITFLLIAVGAVLAYSIAGSGNNTLVSGLNDFSWGALVLTSFPRAMLIMSGTFGLWRAHLITNASFAAGVGVVILVLLGGTTWSSSGLWAPDGIYSRLVSPIVGVVWLLAVSRVLLTRSPATRSGW